MYQFQFTNKSDLVINFDWNQNYVFIYIHLGKFHHMIIIWLIHETLSNGIIIERDEILIYFGFYPALLILIRSLYT